MAVTEVLVEFVPDFTKVDAAFEQLAASGAVDKKVADSFRNTTKAMQEQEAEISDLKKQLSDLGQLATKMGKQAEDAFAAGIQDALDEAGVSLDEFLNALKKGSQQDIPKVTKAAGSLRQELKNLTQQIAQAKASGGPVDANMIKRAGELKDAIADANAEIANAGSDTRNIDNVIGSVQALAGGFAIAQGAAALFGEENEDLQKALLKVNAALALSQGVQQVLNAVQKEGALVKLADVIAIKGQAAAQTIYTAVTGRATAATVAFKVALATTGIGLFVVGMLALITALQDTEDELEDVNRLIDQQNSLLELNNATLQGNTNIAIARAQALGKAESELIRIRGRAINSQIELLESSNERLRQQQEQVGRTSEAWFALNKQIEANNDEIRGLGKEAVALSFNLQKQLADEAKAAAEKAKDAAKKAAEEARKLRETELQNRIDQIQKELVEVEKGTAEEIRIRQRLVIAQAALEIFQAKGNQDRINLIIAQSLDARFQLQKGYTDKVNLNQKEALANLISDLDKYTEEVNAKINLQLENELRLRAANSGKVRRQLARRADDETLDLDTRLRALGSLEAYELGSIDRRIEATRKLIIPEEEKNIRIKELEDQREQIIEETEAKVTAITEKGEKDRKAIRDQTFSDVLNGAKGVADVWNNLNSLLATQENNRIQGLRNQLAGLVEAGAITEKQAKLRQQNIEAQEKQAKIRQARRDRDLALFQAVINGASAIAEAAPNPFLIAFTSALVAAQIGIIASRPLPRFATGKKNRYKGPGIVGEAGAELVEQDGRLWVADKKTTVYLNPDDKVYTPQETKQIMQYVNPALHSGPGQNKGHDIDYDRLGASVGRHIKGTTINIDKDFITESVSNGLSKNNYFNRRYSSKN